MSGLDRGRLRSWAHRAWPYVVISVTLWVARYWHSHEFGLYEDDLTYLPRAAAMSLQEVVAFAFDPERILTLQGQGQAFSYSFMYLFTNLGWRLGDLHGPYWLGYAIEAINAGLFYALIKRVHSRSLGLLSGLAYVLYSADTTQAYLTLSLGFHPSLTFLLLAGHAYLSRKRWLAYPLAALMLLTYETAYTVFLAIPLLASLPRRERTRALASHVFITGLILAGVVVWRVAVGDDRVVGLDLGEVLTVPTTHMIQGPLVSLATYLYRPIQALQSLDVDVVAATVVGSVFIARLVARLDLAAPASLETTPKRYMPGAPRGAGILASLGRAWTDLPESVRSLLRLSLVGLLMLVLAYPLTFTVRAYALSGRDTRVHAAGVVGAAIFLGSMLLLGLRTAETLGRRRWISGALGVWFGMLVGYGFVIQRDYRLAWEYQKEFWSELVLLLPDVGEGTTVLVDPDSLVDTQQIGGNYWNLPAVLEQLYDFPDDWEPPPRVVRLAENWEEHILARDAMVVVNPVTTYSPPSVWGVVRRSQTILIETSVGELQRSAGPLQLDGEPIWLRPLPETTGEPPYAHGFLYRYLIQPDGLDAVKG